jgi:hypothetical protein
VAKKPGRTKRQSEPSVRVRTSIGGSFETKFGSVTVTGKKPTAASVRANVERSSKALERLSKALTKPGVVVRPKKDVPQFSVDENEPGVFIRRLNNRIERGRIVNGAFKPLA